MKIFFFNMSESTGFIFDLLNNSISECILCE
jgi:hypothetical protein